MATSKTSDYLILLVVAMCAYFLATVGTQQRSREDATTGGGVILGPRTDKATGIKFGDAVAFPSTGKKQPLSLLGVGTRKKAILNIYSLGVYASKPLAKQWTSGKIAKNGHARCQALSDSKSPKAVQLTFAMGIGPDKIAEAISGLSTVSEKVRTEFHDMIVEGLGGKMRKGESMSFEWKGSDTISVTARGKPIGSMKNKDLAQGVLSLYVGPKSVSPSLLHDLNCR